MNRVLIVLINTLNTEKNGSTNYRIAKYLLNNIDNLENCNLGVISRECFVSKATISRFARCIGFEDFLDLKHEIIQISKDKRKPFKVSNGDISQYKESYIDGIIKNIENIKNSLDYTIIDKLISDIHTYDNVFAFGYLQSEYIALGLQNDLYTSKKLINSRINFHEQLECIENLDSSSLIIIFSLSGTYFDRFELLNKHLFKSKRPKIYMVTGNRFSNFDKYISEKVLFDVEKNYSSHPFALQIVSNIISLGYYNKYKT